MTVYLDMSERDYHARPELSSTGARRLLDSPARFRYYQDHPQPHKAVFDVGTAAHTKILGVGANIVEYPADHLTASGNVSTKKETVAWESEQRLNGLIPITPQDARRVDRMAEAVLADHDARQILERVTGREVSIITEVQGVPVRARFDIYGDGEAADLKTGRDASPSGFNRAVGGHGYFIQRRWYDDAHYAETGERLRAFPLIVVESAAPHLVGVYDLDVMYDDTAADKCQRARRIYRECAETGVWPAYGRRTLTAPTWIMYDADEEEITI